YTGADFTLGLPKIGDSAVRGIKISFGSYIDGNKIKRPFLNEQLGLSNKSKFSSLYLREDDKSYLLASVRYGHSAGMSQTGAFQMSTEGKSYKDILTFYYLMGTETKLITKNWPIDNGVTAGPVPADTDSAPTQPSDGATPATYKVTKYSAKGYVTAKTSLNVRSGPATSYKKLGSLKKKAKVTITGKSGLWYRIKYGDGSGFVTKSYIKITSATKEKTDTSVYPFKAKVNIKKGKIDVRAGAGSKYKKLGVLKKGAKVTVKGAKGSWYKITYKKKTAYVMKKYLKKY
ncbi:MAG: SH3 domain-containing protein, partial [Clostridiales Family XIII bacterium]|nr:SH3 domain-containing protein [Clostridiales Family XIII bacterium]